MKISNAAAAVLFLYAAACGLESRAAQVAFPEAGNKTVKVEIADDPGKRALGLMFRDSLAEDRGMWFDFPAEDMLVFWMKNVRFPIDILFIDRELTIRTIWKSVPPCASEPCPRYPSAVPAKYALEVTSGFCEKYGVRENQKVTVSR